MSLGLAIFASVVLILAVYHAGFRKVVIVSGAAVVVLSLIGAAGYFAYNRYTAWQAAREEQKVGTTSPIPKDAITLHSPSYNAVTRKYEVQPCPNLPIGSVLDGYCVLSGVVVQNFRPEMCVGKILENGDCQTAGPSWATGGVSIQLCPYGLAINQQGECPAWDVFDRVGAEQQLREYRAKHK